MEPIDADAIPGIESRSSQSQYWELGSGVGVAPGPSPAPKGIPDVDVAAGGCPASSRQGWREGLGAPAGPAFRQGGRANRRPLQLEGEVGFPRRQQMALRAAALRLHPRQGNSRQGAANTPPGGLAVLRALDEF